VAKHNQDRNEEALNDLDAAMAADPFAQEIMIAKFDLLQQMDRLRDAIDLYAGGWRHHAMLRATTLANRILARITAGGSMADAVRSIPELMFLYGYLYILGKVNSSMEALMEHLEGELQGYLRHAWDSWRSTSEDNLRDEWSAWNLAHPESGP